MSRAYYPPRRNTSRPVTAATSTGPTPDDRLYPDPRLEPDTPDQTHDRWLDARDRAADKCSVDPWQPGLRFVNKSERESKEPTT